MYKKYDAIVFIGRFQPMHNAHLSILKAGLTLAKKVIVVVGSSGQPRSPDNPWTFEERKGFLHSALDNSMDRNNTIIEPSYNTTYNDQAWAIRVAEIVAKHTNSEDKIAIIGHKKPGDTSTFYLDMFPQWEFVNHESILLNQLDATTIRQIYFGSLNIDFLASVVPSEVMRTLKAFRTTEEYQDVKAEVDFINQYKQTFASLPYPPIFSTADAVVVQSGHVLMIKRRAVPGKGLWALPGGFVNANTDASVEAAALRELYEETGIKVPTKVLRGNIKGNKVFDAIKRSARGRTITHAFHIQLPDGPLPKVKGADDAEKAKWIPIAELDRSKCFEDHYEIIQHFIGG